MQTWFDFDQDITDPAINQWRDHLRSCVCAGGGRFEHMSLECLIKLSMWFDAYDGYFVVNIIRWSCVHMHFRCFEFHKLV